MSRETDSPSSGPQGRGGAAYPSGTPPYGTPAGGPDAGLDADRMEPVEPPADEPETQTTLTTRIRINIPGSRPIPPVVVRKPVGEDAGGSGGGAGGSAGQDIPGVPKAHAAPAPEPAPQEPAASGDGKGAGEEKTSDWFAPRKPAAASSAAGASGASGASAGQGGASAPGGGRTPAGGTPPRGDLPYRGGAKQEPGQRPAPPKSALSDLGGGATGPTAPTSSPSGPAGAPGRGPAGRPGGSGPLGGPNGTGPMTPPPAPSGPAGPTTGPATGAGAPPPAAFRQQGAPAAPAGRTPDPVQQPGPSFLQEGPEPPRMSDDTAVLTPQKPAPAPGPTPSPAPGQVSGDTLTSGIPVVPPGQGAPPSPFAPQGPPAGDGAAPVQISPQPARPATTARPAKKGRNKLVLAAGGVIGLFGIAYGAGLLMNHSDVPKGTTVLGVDIGGGTRDEAVKKLDAALGKRTTEPLQLTVDGKKAALEPEQAGLSLDTQATVREAAGSDYNPVSVIGSLFGGERVVEAELPVDEEKLTDALERISGATSSGEGGITLSPGKATPVYGKEGKRINPQGSVAAIEAAYRRQLETGRSEAVELPVVTAEPKVTKAEVDRMMKEFATPAMSGMITVRAESGEFVQFSPEKSIYKFVRVVSTPDGQLTEKYDPAALKELYGSTFDGVMITRGTGEKTAVTEQDVIGAVRQALRGKTAAERIVTIETNPS
ncbi:hypothetical protein [Streptomyces indicus]|uniref:Peptidoglycan binding domain-containing protein n=1 Tax=Streptomyces indicus TaxID=417292 RepID=A0A1G9FYQ7_9ACTN|nr:hypothetical protein [Streptomyces indicus]SDK93283.1 hypothetical protein SAMN05421806_114133 [Streptomyces indicus]